MLATCVKRIRYLKFHPLKMVSHAGTTCTGSGRPQKEVMVVVVVVVVVPSKILVRWHEVSRELVLGVVHLLKI